MGVGHLERWAEMLQTLQDIGDTRMPKVTDLLRNAAEQSASSQSNKPKPAGPSVGNVRNQSSGAPQQEEQKPEDSPKPPVPSIADVESSQQPVDPAAPSDEKSEKKKPSASRLTLPKTILNGPPSKSENKPSDPSEENALQPAVEAQAELLAEFDKNRRGTQQGSRRVGRHYLGQTTQSGIARAIQGRTGNQREPTSIPQHRPRNIQKG